MEDKRINEKNKVGIVTLYHNNYNFGGLLQAYALPKVIKEHFGIEAEQIDYIPAEQKTKIKPNNDKKSVLQYLYQLVYNFGIVFFGTISKKNLYQRYDKGQNARNKRVFWIFYVCPQQCASIY